MSKYISGSCPTNMLWDMDIKGLNRLQNLHPSCLNVVFRFSEKAEIFILTFQIFLSLPVFLKLVS